jgi:plasmid stabilization system protein ParE
MAYAVEFTLRGERDLTHLYEYISAEHSPAARRWFNGLEKTIFKLERNPRRCSRAAESRATGRRLRHLLYGTKPDVYRVLYEIDETHNFVRVLTIRHGARDALVARGPKPK